MLVVTMPARGPGRPPLDKHPMPAADRKARSRSIRPKVAQLNVEVPVEVREAVRTLADATGKTQAEVLVAAVTEYVTRHR